MVAASSRQARLQAVVRHGERWTAIRLSGVIDEHNGLPDLTARIRHDTLLVDLAGIYRINSVGVRDWVNWMAELHKRRLRVVLFDCSPAIMDQVNLVRNFAGAATVFTFFAPYYCDKCGKEGDERLNALDLRGPGRRAAPQFPCGKAACGNALDDVEENYFGFIEDQPREVDREQLEPMVAAARVALDAGASDAAPLVSGPGAGGARTIAQLGVTPDPERSQSTISQVAARLGAAAPPSQATGRRGGDVVFVGVLLVMLGLLGVIVYLIVTLE